MRKKKIFVGLDFVFILAVFYLIDTQGIFPLAVIAAIVHELGHLLAMKGSGAKIEGIYLSAYGAEIKMSAYPMISYRKEIAIALAGPFAGALLAILLNITGNDTCILIAGFSMILTLFNLLPATPLDGGRALKFLALLFFDEIHQEKISKVGNILSATFLITLCIVVNIKIAVSPSLCIFCVFVAVSFLKDFFE